MLREVDPAALQDHELEQFITEIEEVLKNNVDHREPLPVSTSSLDHRESLPVSTSSLDRWEAGFVPEKRPPNPRPELKKPSLPVTPDFGALISKDKLCVVTPPAESQTVPVFPTRTESSPEQETQDPDLQQALATSNDPFMESILFPDHPGSFPVVDDSRVAEALLGLPVDHSLGRETYATSVAYSYDPSLAASGTDLVREGQEGVVLGELSWKIDWACSHLRISKGESPTDTAYLKRDGLLSGKMRSLYTTLYFSDSHDPRYRLASVLAQCMLSCGSYHGQVDVVYTYIGEEHTRLLRAKFKISSACICRLHRSMPFKRFFQTNEQSQTV